MDWEEAEDVKVKMLEILEILDLPYIDSSRIFCYRTEGSASRAIARTWAFPKIFQRALNIKPAYVIEVISKRYDKMSDADKTKVMIHELLHIPKNFSGALLPHQTRSRNLHKTAAALYKEYRQKTEDTNVSKLISPDKLRILKKYIRINS